MMFGGLVRATGCGALGLVSLTLGLGNGTLAMASFTLMGKLPILVGGTNFKAFIEDQVS